MTEDEAVGWASRRGRGLPLDGPGRGVGVAWRLLQGLWFAQRLRHSTPSTVPPGLCVVHWFGLWLCAESLQVHVGREKVRVGCLAVVSGGLVPRRWWAVRRSKITKQ